MIFRTLLYQNRFQPAVSQDVEVAIETKDERSPGKDVQVQARFALLCFAFKVQFQFQIPISIFHFHDRIWSDMRLFIQSNINLTNLTKSESDCLNFDPDNPNSNPDNIIFWIRRYLIMIPNSLIPILWWDVFWSDLQFVLKFWFWIIYLKKNDIISNPQSL